MLDAIKNVPYFIHKAFPHLQKDPSFLKEAQEANPDLKKDQLFMTMRLDPNYKIFFKGSSKIHLNFEISM